MSVVVAVHVRDGIVIASDTRMTVKDGNGNTMYKDDTVKIFPFPNRMAVAYCGDASFSNGLTVSEFLYRCRSKFGNGCRIFDLPSKLLNEYQKLNVESHVTFFVVGYMANDLGCCVYKVDTNSRTIVLNWSDNNFGASFGGMTDITYAMMKNANYAFMSLDGCMELTKASVLSTIESFKFQNPQSVGGDCNMYVISCDGKQVGWVRDECIVSDADAPIDAYDKLMQSKVENLVKQASKNSKPRNSKSKT